MKLPKYLHVEWSTKPTEFDDVGCEGLYIQSLRVDWWGWIPLLTGNLFRRSWARITKGKSRNASGR